VLTRFFWPPEIPRFISSPTSVSAHTSKRQSFQDVVGGEAFVFWAFFGGEVEEDVVCVRVARVDSELLFAACEVCEDLRMMASALAAGEELQGLAHGELAEVEVALADEGRRFAAGRTRASRGRCR
jgi:hypothetical protein